MMGAAALRLLCAVAPPYKVPQTTRFVPSTCCLSSAQVQGATRLQVLLQGCQVVALTHQLLQTPLSL